MPNAIFFNEGWCVSIGGVKLQDSMYKYINNWVGKHRLRQYLYTKSLIAWNIFPEIDFEILEECLNGMSQEMKLWFCKHWTNFCGIGRKMFQMKLWDNELCPCCRQIPETNAMHILICPHKSIKLVREKRFHDILEWLRKEHTDPLLLQMIENFLVWRRIYY